MDMKNRKYVCAPLLLFAAAGANAQMVVFGPGPQYPHPEVRRPEPPLPADIRSAVREGNSAEVAVPAYPIRLSPEQRAELRRQIIEQEKWLPQRQGSRARGRGRSR
jgi:hypothetical protein